MSADAIDDWRLWGSATLAADLPAAFPGGPSHKAGAKIFSSALTRDEFGRPLGFIMPSPTALALGLAIDAATRSAAIRDSLDFQAQYTRWGGAAASS